MPELLFLRRLCQIVVQTGFLLVQYAEHVLTRTDMLGVPADKLGVHMYKSYEE